LYLATYVLFFPQLVAGPIERPQNLLPQFRVAHVFDYERARSGFMLIAWGLFKKVAVADRLGHAVNVVYGDPEAFSGSALLLATYFFAVQIYCDFSGYSDIAIGSARVLGFKLMRNFDRPYFSQSIAEFWRRWHISLSTWFRDYVYVPLGGSRVPLTRLVLNLLIVFTLSGLWHGANWTFVVWGALNGIYLAGSVLFGGARGWLLRQSGLDRVPLLHAGVRWAITFHLVLITWVFFRSTSLAQAFGVLGAIAVARPGASLPFDVAGGRTLLALSVGALVGFELLQSRSGSIREGLWRQPAFVRWPAYVVFACLLLLLGDFASEQQFIYFQF
jgi:D-alanyl-lipoteichoic acid acyltransferase DltB (MBOAT superfamily)